MLLTASASGGSSDGRRFESRPNPGASECCAPMNPPPSQHKVERPRYDGCPAPKPEKPRSLVGLGIPCHPLVTSEAFSPTSVAHPPPQRRRRPSARHKQPPHACAPRRRAGLERSDLRRIRKPSADAGGRSEIATMAPSFPSELPERGGSRHGRRARKKAGMCRPVVSAGRVHPRIVQLARGPAMPRRLTDAAGAQSTRLEAAFPHVSGGASRRRAVLHPAGSRESHPFAQLAGSRPFVGSRSSMVGRTA